MPFPYGGYGSINYSPPSTSFGSGGGASYGQHGTYMIPGMGDVYSQLLGLNEQNYGNILGAYAGGETGLAGHLPGIYGGYGNVLSGVENTLGLGGALGGSNWGVASPAALAIEQQAKQTAGNIEEQMTDQGWGNSSIGANLQEQNTLLENQALGGLGAQLAQTAAGYQGNIGMAGLGAQMQGLGMQSGLNQALMGNLAGYHFSNTAGQLAGPFGYNEAVNHQASQSQAGGTGANFPVPNPFTGGGQGGGGGVGQQGGGFQQPTMFSDQGGGGPGGQGGMGGGSPGGWSGGGGMTGQGPPMGFGGGGQGPYGGWGTGTYSPNWANAGPNGGWGSQGFGGPGSGNPNAPGGSMAAPPAPGDLGGETGGGGAFGGMMQEMQNPNLFNPGGNIPYPGPSGGGYGGLGMSGYPMTVATPDPMADSSAAQQGGPGGIYNVGQGKPPPVIGPNGQPQTPGGNLGPRPPLSPLAQLGGLAAGIAGYGPQQQSWMRGAPGMGGGGMRPPGGANTGIINPRPGMGGMPYGNAAGGFANPGGGMSTGVPQAGGYKPPGGGMFGGWSNPNASYGMGPQAGQSYNVYGSPTSTQGFNDANFASSMHTPGTVGSTGVGGPGSYFMIGANGQQMPYRPPGT